MAYIPSHKKQHKTNPGEARLQLTSMMDMFTIILVFLLKTYSTHGQLINPSQDLTLPSSMTQQMPELGLDVTVSSDWILVNGKPVVRTSSLESQDGYIVPGLRDELFRYAREAERMEELYGAKFSGKVTIQGDKNLPYRTLIKVMATCGQSDYPNMRLVVYREEG
jgi:biopolymer transport protein ExbD